MTFSGNALHQLFGCIRVLWTSVLMLYLFYFSFICHKDFAMKLELLGYKKLKKKKKIARKHNKIHRAFKLRFPPMTYKMTQTIDYYGKQMTF